MKWAFTQVAVAALALSGAAAHAQARKLPSFGNAAVVAAPQGEIAAERTADGAATRLLFRHWDDAAARTIRLQILNAPLRYRAFPSRGARMAVEAFSDSYDVGFTTHRQKEFVQILVGEELPGDTIAYLLTSRELENRLTGDLADALLGRRFDDVRDALLEDRPADPASALLRDARVSLVDLARLGPSGTTCPELPALALDTAAAQEAAFLVATCLRAKAAPDAAMEVLARLAVADPAPRLAARTRELWRRLLLGRVLDADRRGQPVLVAARFLRHKDELVGDAEIDLSTFEALADNLKHLGLSSLVAFIADRAAVDADTKRGTEAAGAIAETYLHADQLLRAADAASYFLSRKPPEWIAGRLQRVRGRAALQTGMWADAATDLEAARALVYDFGPEDALGRAEAILRRGPIAAPSEADAKGKAKAKDKVKDKATPEPAPALVSQMLPRLEDLPDGFAPWRDRLAGQAALEEGRKPEAKLLELQPAHVLYRAADAFAERGDAQTAKELLERAESGAGGWAVLAGIDRDILALQKRLEAYRIAAGAGK
jgi:hypothetical protein